MLALLTILFAIALADRPVYNTWQRVIVSGKDIVNYTSAASRVIDANGTRTKAFLSLTDADIQWQTDQAFARFKNLFGFDIPAMGVYNAATDQWTVPGYGVILQYANGDDLKYRVISDTWNEEVEKRGAHIFYQWGRLFQFTAAGTFPGGPLAGKPFNKGDIIGGTQQLFLDLSKRDHWADPHKCDWRCKDVNDNGSRRPSQSLSGPDGPTFVNNYDTQELVNRASSIPGRLTSHATTELGDDGFIIQRTRNVVTLNYGPMDFRLPYANAN